MSDLPSFEVYDVLDDEGPLSIDEITTRIIDGDGYCSECGRTTQEYNLKREAVRNRLKDLMDEGRVASTPEWNYELVR